MIESAAPTLSPNNTLQVSASGILGAIIDSSLIFNLMKGGVKLRLKHAETSYNEGFSGEGAGVTQATTRIILLKPTALGFQKRLAEIRLLTSDHSELDHPSQELHLRIYGAKHMFSRTKVFDGLVPSLDVLLQKLEEHFEGSKS